MRVIHPGGAPLAWMAAMALGSAGCRPAEARAPEKVEAPTAAPPPQKEPRFDALERLGFNRRAVELNEPLFWRQDANRDRALEPSELVVTWPRQRSAFVGPDGSFTAKFHEVYARLVAPDVMDDLPPDEKKRRIAVRLELAQGRPTLVESDFSSAAPADKALASHVSRVAELIERLYARQKGTFGMEADVPADDPASLALLQRNQGPWCVAPRTEIDPDCRALQKPSKPVFGLYPSALQREPEFCRKLEKQKNGSELVGHFSVVVPGGAPNTFAAVKYSEAYAADMGAVAAELTRAASVVGPAEAALQTYLQRAAQAFLDNDWEPANRAWAAMNAENSKYYLRVAPDEVYYEPCGWKAGFALTFARINQKSLELQKRLEPIKQQLENELAALAGKPYVARVVNFKLPDFIDIVLNAGDSRSPLGGTVGQSLPNWGEVAQSGGRTVAMTNLFTDPDSKQSRRDVLASLYCKATMAKVSVEPELSVIGTVLHEAAHNLGPSHDYAVRGQVDSAIFGGPLASMIEELKAQTAAMYLTARLVERQIMTESQAESARIEDVSWALGHVAEGMYDSGGRDKPYNQLASIQLGRLIEGGVLEWRPAENAASGEDAGCFEAKLAAWQATVGALLKDVLELKARGDRARALALKKRFVDDDGDWKKLRTVIGERFARAPKASLVYAITGLSAR